MANYCRAGIKSLRGTLEELMKEHTVVMPKGLVDRGSVIFYLQG
jgi:hypothetical protein